ncbi:hypothetical protein BpHYR1_012671 [Brachionus plicatilis]|uniref:Snake toxin/toxin-like domain-containing protein n=1 Tax=Brachionus plicatilis TaxID=10195 RepID=A0A3M7Q6P4_BRAPC|nr:hypothetical protein BpHYR1_012671 [Brachionus plicatilis]
MNSFVILMSVSLMANLVPTSHELECYECVGCAGIGTLKACSSGERFCQKIVSDQVGIKMVAKGCVYFCVETDPVFFKLFESEGGSFCCNTDGCNFGIKVSSSVQLLFLSTGFALMTKFF